MPRWSAASRLQIEAGCDGLIVCGSLGEGPMLSHDEKLAVLKTAQGVAGRQAGAADHQRGGDPRGAALARQRRRGRRRRADGGAEPDLPHQPAGDGGDAEGGGRCRRAAGHDLFQPPRLPGRRDRRRSWRSWPPTRCSWRSRNPPTTSAARPRSSTASATAIDLFTGVDNLAFEALAVGAVGWVAGLVTAFPRETVAIYQLMKQGRREEALAIYRWFRPLLDLDVSTYLVQNIKLAEVLCDRHQRPRAHAAPAAVGRAAQGGREDRQGRAGDAAGAAEVLRVAPKLHQSPHEQRPPAQIDIAVVGAGIVGICAAAYSPRPGTRSRSSTAPASARRPAPATPRHSPSPTCCRSPTRACCGNCRNGSPTRSGRSPSRRPICRSCCPGCGASGAPAPTATTRRASPRRPALMKLAEAEWMGLMRALRHAAHAARGRLAGAL